MSAYIVDDATINRVVGFLAKTDSRREIARDLDCDLATREGRAKLAEAMFALNIQAIEARYGEGQATDFRALDFAYRAERTSAIQAYKSLRCWLYQCSEGEISETSLLYAVMERASDGLAHEIVAELPAYQDAAWD